MSRDLSFTAIAFLLAALSAPGRAAPPPANSIFVEPRSCEPLGVVVGGFWEVAQPEVRTDFCSCTQGQEGGANVLNPKPSQRDVAETEAYFAELHADGRRQYRAVKETPEVNACLQGQRGTIQLSWVVTRSGRAACTQVSGENLPLSLVECLTGALGRVHFEPRNEPLPLIGLPF